MTTEHTPNSPTTIEALLKELTDRHWVHDLTGFGQMVGGATYSASLTRPRTPDSKGGYFTARGATPFEALNGAYQQALASLPKPVEGPKSDLEHLFDQNTN